mgnify:CR=1 FL=1
MALAEIPSGLPTAVIGTPYFAWRLRRNREGWDGPGRVGEIVGDSAVVRLGFRTGNGGGRMSADLDRAHAILRRIGDGVRGCKVEVLRGRIVMSPVRPFHKRTAFALWEMLERRLGTERRCIGGVGISFAAEATELRPDVAVIPASEEERNLETYPPGIVDLAVDVVTPGSAIRDHADRRRMYAEADVPVHAVFDPYAARCEFMSDPRDGAYSSRREFAYGEQVPVPGPFRETVIDTSVLPIDPGKEAGPTPPG